jgi:hypothetical protein
MEKEVFSRWGVLLNPKSRFLIPELRRKTGLLLWGRPVGRPADCHLELEVTIMITDVVNWQCPSLSDSVM